MAQMAKCLPAVQETCGFDLWVGKTPWRRKWQPTPVFLPGEFHGLRSLVGYSPWSRCKESLQIFFHFWKKIKTTYRKSNDVICSEYFQMVFSELTQPIHPLTPNTPPLPSLPLVTSCWAERKGRKLQVELIWCAYFSSPGPDGRKPWGQDLVNMRVLLKALGTGNSSPGRGQNASQFPKVDSQAMFEPWDQPHHSKPAWPHGGHIKAKHQAISGTSPLQVSDGNASGRSGDDGPNLLPSGSWLSASPGQTAPLCGLGLAYGHKECVQPHTADREANHWPSLP